MKIFTEAQLDRLKSEIGNYEDVEYNTDKFEIKQIEIEKELKKQAEALIEENDLLFWDDMGAPDFDEGNSKVIEVENIGKLMYVGIDFSKVNVSDEEYEEIKECIKTIARSKNEFDIMKAKNKIESYKENAVEVVFREARQFDFSYPEVRKNAAQLMESLCLRYLKGRNIILAVLKAGKVAAHVHLAILTAGQLRDKNAVKYLMEKMDQTEFFENCLEALLKIGPKDRETIKEIMDMISNLDSDRKDLIDICMAYATQFKNFGADSAKVIFESYNSCTRPGIRPIFTRAMKSLEEDSVGLLKKQLMLAKDDTAFFNVCQTLGRMKNAEALNILIEAYDKYPKYRFQVIKGISLTGSQDAIPLITKVLREESNHKLLSECIRSLAFIGDDSVETYIEPFLQMKDERIYIEALFVKARRANKEALDELVDVLINGTSNNQYAVERVIHLLKYEQLIYVARKALVLPESQAVLIITALSRARVLPKEIGEVLRELLNKNSIPLKVEIYRMIGKFANTKNEILPQEILYEAIDKTQNIRVKREIENILKAIPQKTSTLKTS